MPQRRAQQDEQVDVCAFGTSRGRLFRTRFIAAYAEHLSDADTLTDVSERPDSYFQSLFLESVLASRLGFPPPHPWFIEFCLRYITDDINGLVPQAGSRTKMAAIFDC